MVLLELPFTSCIERCSQHPLYVLQMAKDQALNRHQIFSLKVVVSNMLMQEVYKKARLTPVIFINQLKPKSTPKCFLHFLHIISFSSKCNKYDIRHFAGIYIRVYISKGKDRVMVWNIENLTKLLYQLLEGTFIFQRNS